MPPSLSSRRRPWSFRCLARSLSFVSILDMMVLRTRAAKMGLKGHPCGSPSCCSK